MCGLSRILMNPKNAVRVLLQVRRALSPFSDFLGLQPKIGKSLNGRRLFLIFAY